MKIEDLEYCEKHSVNYVIGEECQDCEGEVLKWEVCQLSGNLKAEGKKGQYWLIAGAWKYLYRLTPRRQHMPLEESLGFFHGADGGKEEAQLIDNIVEADE